MASTVARCHSVRLSLRWFVRLSHVDIVTKWLNIFFTTFSFSIVDAITKIRSTGCSMG